MMEKKRISFFMHCFSVLLRRSGWIFALLFLASTANALEVEKFRDLYAAEDYEALVILCSDMREEIGLMNMLTVCFITAARQNS